MMKNSLVIGMALWAMGETLQANPSIPVRKPDAFPSVSVTPGATVRYGMLPLDTWTGKVAYLLVEGDSTNGYSRVFAWIPNDSRFGRPQEFKPRPSETHPNSWIFGEIENRDAFEEEKLIVRYILSTSRQSRGAGSQQVFDYVTGKTVTRTWGAATWHVIGYRVNMEYAWGKDVVGAREGNYPLALAHQTELRLYDTWEKVPVSALGLLAATVQGRHQLFETRDSEKGRLVCQFSGYRHGVSVIRAPSDGRVTLKITPYMRESIWEETRTLGEFQQKPFEAEIPYSWYTLSLSGFQYGRFILRGVVETAETLVPLNRPPPQGR